MTLAERAADEGWETNEDGEDDDRGRYDYDEDAIAERALEINMEHRDEADREAYLDGDLYNRTGTNPYYCQEDKMKFNSCDPYGPNGEYYRQAVDIPDDETDLYRKGDEDYQEPEIPFQGIFFLPLFDKI